MVATKGGKARYTYAERVLGAFSEVQRNHKKHAVHIATLRAQVKKNAEVKKDQLGPQWKSWIGRAVHNLEEQGVLTPATSKGSVTLTPDAKKAIHQVRERRHTSASKPSPKQEDALWREVSHQFSGRGLKRKKRRRHTVSYEESDEEVEVLGALRGRGDATPSKRPRKTKKPLSRMTKAELQAEARRLQQALGDLHLVVATDRSGSQPGSNDLQEQLKAREEELQKLSSELDEVKVALATERDKEPDSSIRMLTPASATTHGVDLSSPAAIVRSNLFARRPLVGMTRTQSGSFISNISKQATPAPSDGYPSSPTRADTDFYDYGPHDDGTDAGFGDSEGVDDVFGGRLMEASQHKLPMTPEKSPAEVEMVDLRERMQELVNKGDETQRAMQVKLDIMQAELATKTSDVDKLQSLLSTRTGEKSVLEATIASQAQRLASLQTSIADVQILADLKGKRVSELEALNEELRVSHDDTVAALQQEANTHASNFAELTQQKKAVEIVLSNLEVALDAMNLRISAGAEEFDRQVKSLQEQLASSRSDNTSLVRRLSDSETQLRSIQGAKEHAEREMVEQRIVTENLESTVKDLVTESEVLRGQKSSLQDRVNSLEHEAQASRLKEVSLAANLEEAKSEAETLTREMEGKELAIVQLQDEKMAMEQDVSWLLDEFAKGQADKEVIQNDFEVAREQVALCHAKMDSLTQNLTLERRAKESVAAELEVARGACASLEAQVRLQKDELCVVQAELETVRASEINLHSALQAMVAQNTAHTARAEKLGAEVAMLANDLDSTRKDVDTLRAELVRAKDSLLSRTAELEDTKVLMGDVRQKLVVEQGRAASLERDMRDAVERARGAEEDVQELKEAKEADAEVIESLKRAYARLRRIQMEGLHEMDEKISSAQASPVPTSKRKSTNMLDNRVSIAF